MYTSPSGMFLLDCSSGIWCHSFITFSFTNENKQNLYIYMYMCVDCLEVVISAIDEWLICGSCFWHQSCTLAPSNEDEFLRNVNHSWPPHSSKIEEIPLCSEQGVRHIFLLANLEALCRCRPFSCQAHPKVLFCHRPLASTFDEDRVRHKTALIRRHLQPCRPRFWSIAIINYCSHCMDSHGCKLQLIVLTVLAISTLQNNYLNQLFS